MTINQKIWSSHYSSSTLGHLWYIIAWMLTDIYFGVQWLRDAGTSSLNKGHIIALDTSATKKETWCLVSMSQFRRQHIRHFFTHLLSGHEVCQLQIGLNRERILQQIQAVRQSWLRLEPWNQASSLVLEIFMMKKDASVKFSVGPTSIGGSQHRTPRILRQRHI